MGLLKCDHIKRLISLTGDYIKRLSLYLDKSEESVMFNTTLPEMFASLTRRGFEPIRSVLVLEKKKKQY